MGCIQRGMIVGKFILSQEVTAWLGNTSSESDCILFSSLELNAAYQNSIMLYLYDAKQKKQKKDEKKIEKEQFKV